MGKQGGYDLKLTELKVNPDRAGGASSDKWRLFENRLNYAWKSFEHHAKQRYTAFNFFIVFVGILASAYGTLFREGEFVIAAAMAAIAAYITYVFKRLDQRNQELVYVSEDVLYALEKDVLFDRYRRQRLSEIEKWKLKSEPSGGPPTAKLLGILLGQEEISPNRHSKWFPCLQNFIILCFVFGAGVAGYYSYLELEAAEEPTGGRMVLSCQQGTGGAAVTCKLTPE